MNQRVLLHLGDVPGLSSQHGTGASGSQREGWRTGALPATPRPHCPSLPCTDGGDELHGGRHFGLHGHDVEVHEIVESQMKHTVVWGAGRQEIIYDSAHQRPGVLVQTLNPSFWKPEARGSLSSRPPGL